MLENCQVCMWIWSEGFREDFGRRVVQKNEYVSENLTQNVIVDIAINDADDIRAQILESLIWVKKK